SSSRLRAEAVAVAAPGSPGKAELIYLADQVRAETVMRLLPFQGEPTGQVDLPRGRQRMVGPQPHPLVPRLPGEPQALIYQPGPQSFSPRSRVDQEDAQLRRALVGRYQQDASDPLPVLLGDPSRLPAVIVAAGVVGDNPRHQRLEAGVPAELLAVE